MALAERTASIIWEGDVQDGSGTVTLESSGAAGDLPARSRTRSAAT